MACLGRVGSALVGASLFHALCFFVQSQSYQSAWGWFKSVADEVEFSCAEGDNVGCISAMVDKTCSQYTCTVKARAGYTCTAGATMTMKCAKIGDDSTKFAPNSADPGCISNATEAAKYDMTADSSLTWDPAAPTCNKMATEETSPSSTNTAGAEADTSGAICMAASGATVLALAGMSL